MFDKFNEIYQLPAGTSFKFIELWKAILDKYKDIGFSCYPDTALSDGQVFKGGYTCGFSFEWEIYAYSIDDPQPTCYEALCQLLLKYSDYTDWDNNLGEELHKLVREVYKCDTQN